jgi:OOP family OmpA-OmpF porin
MSYTDVPHRSTIENLLENLEKYMKNGITRLDLIGATTPVKIGLIAITLAVSQIAAAAEPGWYLGANIGQSQVDLDESGIVARQLADGFSNIRLSKHDDDIGFKVFGGYQFNSFIGVEGGYFDLGKLGYKTFMNPASIFTSDTTLRGLNVDLVGALPINDKFSVFTRVGVTRYESKDSYRGYGAVNLMSFSDSDRDTSYKYGVGLQYDFNSNLAMRLEAERYDIQDVMFRDSDADMYSLGLVYRFAQPAAAEPARAPVSAVPTRPAAAAPAPTPPPTPAPVRVTLSADSLFSFDSAGVTPAGRAELDKLAADLRGVEYDTIVVIGHTDRIGSQTYNLDLSNRRAVAVRDYLISSARIPAAKITTRGVSGAEPVTTMAQCGSQLSRAQLITCLAPDRRVEVEVIGSRPR